jgi:glycosyltransferase involved in cell wall biosynthesis
MPAGVPGSGVLLLVRNGVDYDARVLRAGRTAARSLGGSPLIIGVAGDATDTPGLERIDDVMVVRVQARVRRLGTLASWFTSRLSRPAGTLGGGGPMSSPGVGAPTSVTAPTRATQSGRLTASARLGRLAAGFSYTRQAVALGRTLRPRVVHANDWNTMWAAVALKLFTGAALVYDSHELWADRNGRWESRSWLIACEALFVRLADQVITASPGYSAALARRYRIQPPVVIRNVPDWPAPAAEPQSSPPTRPLTIYVGGLMPGRGLEQTIDALALAPEMRLRAIGPGAPAYRATLRARALAAGVAERVELCDAVAPAELLDALAEATAGLCLIQPVCRSYELTLPNKLFEYAAAGLPVLASELPVIAAVVREHGFGEVVTPDDPQAIAAGLRRLCEPERWRQAAARARVYARANGWAEEARKLERIYTRVDRSTARGEPGLLVKSASTLRMKRWSRSST